MPVGFAQEIRAAVGKDGLEAVEETRDDAGRALLFASSEGPALKSGPKGLVQFGREEIEILLQSRPEQAAARRPEPRFRLLIGEILDDRRTLGEDLAIIDFERRDIALGIHAKIVGAACGFL